MSTIAVDNARPSAGGTSYSLTSGVAKAHGSVNNNAGAFTLITSYNVSSITDNGVGQCIYTLSNVFSASQPPTAFGGDWNSDIGGVGPGQGTTAIISVSGYHNNVTNSYAVKDISYTHFVSHGDLA